MKGWGWFAIVPGRGGDERCESCRKSLADGKWRYDSADDVKLCNTCYAALLREGEAKGGTQ